MNISSSAASDPFSGSSVLGELERLAKISELDLVDSPSEESFDRITRLAVSHLNVPVALASFVTSSRQYFKSSNGLQEPWATARQKPLSHSFCRHVVETGEPLIVEDARNHHLVQDNPAHQELNFAAYLGFPLHSPCGHRLGAFCVIDHEPRKWTENDIAVVRDFSMLVNSEIELRNEVQKLRSADARLKIQHQAIKETRILLRDILDSVDSSICHVDQYGDILKTNIVWQENEGASCGDISNFFEFCDHSVPNSQDNSEAIGNALQQVLDGSLERFVAELPCYWTGSDSWYQVCITPLHSSGCRGAVVTHLDITDRVIAKQQLMAKTQEAEKLALVAKYTDNAVVITDDQGRVEWVNEGFTRITGYSMDEVIGKRPGKMLQGPDTSQEAVATMRKGLRDQTGFDVEIVNYTKSGNPYWLAIEVRPIHDDFGNVTHFIAVESDITARKNAAIEREKLRKELLDASHLAGMAEMATGVLHNVGNVLNSINVSVGVLSEQISESSISKLRAANQLIQAHSDSLGEFLSQDERGRLFPDFFEKMVERLENENGHALEELMALAKCVEHVKEIVSAQQSYARKGAVLQELGICEIVEDAIQASDSVFEEHQIEIERDFQSSPVVCCDKHKVLQILVNLLSNAKDAVLEKMDERHIRLTVKEEQGRVVIEVADNGVGISEETKSKMFRHGFSTKQHGHGFGLHSSVNNARAIGGDLDVESAGIGHGATFRFSLPRISGQE